MRPKPPSIVVASFTPREITVTPVNGGANDDGKPSKRTFEMICYDFTGLASDEERLPHLDKIRKASEAAAEKNP